MTYTLRHLVRHWRFNLMWLLGLTLASGLLAGLPTYAVGVSAQTLNAQLALQPIQGRNIEIRGDVGALTGALYAQVSQTLGELVIMRVEFHKVEMALSQVAPEAVDGGARRTIHRLNIWSLDRQREQTQVVEGVMPRYEPPHTQLERLRAMVSIPPIEAAIPKAAAEATGMKVGDRIFALGGYTFNIVGILETLDEQADVWWGDSSLFNLVVVPGLNEDTLILPLVVNPAAMTNVLPVQMKTWRLIIDQTQITPDRAETIENQIIGLTTLLSSRQTQLISNLPGILLETRENLATLDMVMMLLGFQAYLFVLYSLVLVTNAGMENLQSEMAVLAGRGATTAQILSTYLLEGQVMALLAGFGSGPLLARGILQGWSWLAGVSIPNMLPVQARLLGLAGALCGWLVLCLTAFPAARRSVLEWQQRRARPAHLSAWQRGGADLFLLVVGGLAYWQLSSSGSFVLVRLRQADLEDPLLLLGPTLFMVGMAMMVLRVFPYFFRALAWLASHRRGLVMQLWLARLARSPLHPAQVILLISLATGLVLFTTAFNSSLDAAEGPLAIYRAGADLVAYPANRSLADFQILPGVVAASPLQRIPVDSRGGNKIVILAVEPASLPLVTSYPAGLTTLTIPAVMGALSVEAPPEQSDDLAANPYTEAINRGKPIPAVFSQSALDKDQGLGSVERLVFPGTQIDILVNGILYNFPTGRGDFILLDRAALAQYIDLETSSFTRYKEVWLDIEPGYYEYLLRIPWVKESIRWDAQHELLKLQSNSFIQGMQHAFDLNSLIVSILSVGGLFLVHYFTSRQRTYEFGVLRAEGLKSGQLLLLLGGEALMSAVIGLAAGTLLGLGLSLGMRAYLNLLLGRVEPGLVLHQVQVGWARVVQQDALLLGGYLLATLLSVGMLLRAGVHRVLRIGDE